MNSTLITHLKEAFHESLIKGHCKSLEEINESLMDYGADSEEIIYFKAWYQKIINLDFIKELSLFEELLFMGKEGFYLKERENKIFHQLDFSSLDYDCLILNLCSQEKLDWNELHPFKSFKVEIFNEIYRATLVHKSLTQNKDHRFFLRRIEKDIYPLNSYSTETDLLENFVKEKKNIIICGSTGSGKTSFLSSLLTNVDKSEHVVTIEDTEEIVLNSKFKTPLFPSSSTKCLNELLSHSLRMTPDRIILGEMRSREVTTFLLAMNTGHKGLISTLHANSAIDAIERMSLMFILYNQNDALSHQEVVRLISKSVEIIIFLEDKKVKEIVRILGSEGGVPYFENVRDSFSANALS